MQKVLMTHLQMKYHHLCSTNQNGHQVDLNLWRPSLVFLGSMSIDLFFFSACGDPPRLPLIEKLGGRALPAKFGAARLVLSPHKPPKT